MKTLQNCANTKPGELRRQINQFALEAYVVLGLILTLGSIPFWVLA